MHDSNSECGDFRSYTYMEGKGKFAVSAMLGRVILKDHVLILGENGGVYGGVVKTRRPGESLSFNLPDDSTLLAVKKDDVWFASHASHGRHAEFEIFAVYVNHPAFMGLATTS